MSHWAKQPAKRSDTHRIVPSGQMEFTSETGLDSHPYKAGGVGGGQEESFCEALEVKTTELQKIKEELKKAKDDAMESWLDSRPLIDELEKLQSNLASAQKQSAMSNTATSEIESQLETTNMSIRSKKDGELKARAIINQKNQALDKKREEMEQLKLERDEERRARSKLKQILRLRRQTLRTLQLTLRAIRVESEAFKASATEAHRHISRAEMDNNTVQLSQEGYNALARREKEETSLADWRVSVSMEQRLLAEESRDLALRRLKESDNKSKERKMKERTALDGNTKRGAELQDAGIRMEAQINNKQIALPRAQPNFIAQSSQGTFQQQLRRSKQNNNKISVNKKKPSIFLRIKTFIVRRITKLFR